MLQADPRFMLVFQALQFAVAFAFAVAQLGIAWAFRRDAVKALAGVWLGACASTGLALLASITLTQEGPSLLFVAITAGSVGLVAASVPVVEFGAAAMTSRAPPPLSPAKLRTWGLSFTALAAFALLLTVRLAAPDSVVAVLVVSRLLVSSIALVALLKVLAVRRGSCGGRESTLLVAAGMACLLVRPLVSLLMGVGGLAGGVALVVNLGLFVAMGILLLLAGLLQEREAVLEQAARLRQAEAMGARSERMESLGLLASGVAHDFNNVLAAVLLSAQSIGEADTSPQVREVLHEIAEAGERGRGLTAQLLAFARRAPAAAPQRIDALARLSALEPLLHRLVGVGRSVAVQPATEALEVMMDPEGFERVLVNLVVNARDASPPGTCITVSAERRAAAPAASSELAGGPYLHLTVADHGQGIPDEVLPHIFEPFFSTKGTQGTGLGLATSYGLVRKAGGDITVTSTVGVGTQFEVWLPIAAQPPASV
jgi:signal transduction histidine kinase